MASSVRFSSSFNTTPRDRHQSQLACKKYRGKMRGMRRRTLLQAIVPRSRALSFSRLRLNAQIRTLTPEAIATLQEVAATVLPASIGADTISLTADRFVAWTNGYQEGIPLQHGYGHPRLVKTRGVSRCPTTSPSSPRSPPPPGRAAAGSARCRSTCVGALLDEALTAANVTQLPARPSGGHVVSDLMAFYFRSSEANDVAHRARIGRQVCRPRSTRAAQRRLSARQPILSPQAPQAPKPQAPSPKTSHAPPRKRRLHHRRRHHVGDAREEARRASPRHHHHRRRGGPLDLRRREPRPVSRSRAARYGEHPWPDDYIEDQKADGIISMTMAVGGLALHWGGACNRFSEEDLRLKSMYGLAADWPLEWDELERYYCEAERALNVAGEPSPYPEDRRSEPYPQPADAAVLQPADAQGLGGAERAAVLRAADGAQPRRRSTAAAVAACTTPAATSARPAPATRRTSPSVS